MRPVPMPQATVNQVKDGYLPFRGGLDLETSPWEVPPGHLRLSQNYELAIEGGYQDIQGYERFDGQIAPSAANYAMLPVDITGSIIVGDTVTGVTSTATGVVIAVDTTDPLQTQLVLARVVTPFVDAETLNVSASPEGTTEDVSVINGANTIQLNAQYLNLAADDRRADILVVPGESAVLGHAWLNDVLYAWRNVSGGASAKMFESTAAGWVEVALGFEMSFTSGGTYEVLEGDTITGQTSTETAVITRVVLESGTWAGSDAAGRFIYASQSGPFTAAELLDVGANLDVATVTADGTAITLSPGGTYEAYNSNFNAPAEADRMYGVDKVNRGFEFDGTVFAPIETGFPTDAPEHVIVHSSHLVYGYGSQEQISGIGTPWAWTILTGADALVTDGQITGFKRLESGEGDATLLVANRHRLHIMYGTDSATWKLTPFRDEVGAFEKTIQQLAVTLFLDDRGFTSFRAVQEFGNFRDSTLTSKIQELINQKRGIALSSAIVRDKNQYRLFFSDNSALYITMKGQKVAGIMPILLDHSAANATSDEDSAGNEHMFISGTDGYVYQMDKGTSFDGEPISAFMSLHYTNDGVRTLKDFMHSVTIEARGSGYASIDYGYELDYGSADTLQPADISRDIEFSVGIGWDAPGATWDTLFWDGQTLAPSTGLDLRGNAENISFSIRKSSDYFAPVRMTGIHYRYIDRRPMR